MPRPLTRLLFDLQILFVTTGLDPVVHADSLNTLRCRMDCRVEPGNDEEWLHGKFASPYWREAEGRVRALYRPRARHIARRRKRHCAHSAMKISTRPVAIQNLE
jgi:hypothetical protein